jgi:hypothetical protein
MRGSTGGAAFLWTAHTPALPWKELVLKFVESGNAGRTPYGVDVAGVCYDVRGTDETLSNLEIS